MSNTQEVNVLQDIQSRLNAPKNLFNKFGKYYYRNCEGILEAVKPLLKEHNVSLVLTDKVKTANDILYVESNAVLLNSNGGIISKVKAQAGIDVNKKGMDYSQAFGSSSSYARKYALNGLFLIDDVRDADATNNHGKKITPANSPIKEVKSFKENNNKATEEGGYF